jgi:hypothetical protein
LIGQKRNISWQDGIADVWAFRTAGDIAKSEMSYLNVVTQLGLDIQSTLREQCKFLKGVVPQNSHGLIADILLFPAARCRAHYRLSESVQYLHDFEASAKAFGFHLSFQFFLQRGLNALAGGRFANALSDFKFAESVARNDLEKMTARLNGLLMQESLGFDLAESLRNFDSDWRLFKESWREGLQGAERTPSLVSVIECIESQWLALVVRLDFIAGSLSKIADEVQRKANLLSWQSLSHVIWIDALGWTQQMTKNTKELTQRLESESSRYQSQFRLGTLKGRLLQGDFDDAVLVTDKIDRLYLWVWNWLLNPKEDLVEKLVVWWEHVLQAAKKQDLSLDDHAKICNATRWICFYCGINDSTVKARMSWAQSAHLIKMPLFDFESHLIDFFVADRQHKSTSSSGTTTRSVVAGEEWKLLREHAAHGEPRFALGEAFRLIDQRHANSSGGGGDDQGPGLNPRSIVYQSGLACDQATIKLTPQAGADRVSSNQWFVESNLTQRWELNQLGQASSGSSLKLHLNPFFESLSFDTATNLESGGTETTSIQSSNLYRFVSLLIESNQCLVQEVVLDCFGSANYDPLIHDDRIARLITQANKEFKGLAQFARRRFQITVTWQVGPLKVTVLGSNRHTATLQSYKDRVWIALQSNHQVNNQSTHAAVNTVVTSKKPSDKNPSKKSMQVGRWIKRDELEKSFNVSKATICRRIETWIQEGVVIRRGVGRSTEYLLTSQFFAQINLLKSGESHGVQ